jgi:RNA-directed DNA polymerase
MEGYAPERAANRGELIRARRDQPTPVRRGNIPTKVAGKLRPLGLPAADDKHGQDVVRLLLERSSAPLCKARAHGFRPRRACHTALRARQKGWTGTQGFLEIDLQGYCTTIDHARRLKLWEKRREDAPVLALSRAMGKAGYVEEWPYHTTYRGPPQGGLGSPMLAHRYLHAFDACLAQKKQAFAQGKQRRQTLRQRSEAKLRALSEKPQRLEASAPLDPDDRRLCSVR